MHGPVSGGGGVRAIQSFYVQGGPKKPFSCYGNLHVLVGAHTLWSVPACTREFCNNSRAMAPALAVKECKSHEIGTYVGSRGAWSTKFRQPLLPAAPTLGSVLPPPPPISGRQAGRPILLPAAASPLHFFRSSAYYGSTIQWDASCYLGLS